MPVHSISLQLALDMPDLDDALRVAELCIESVDYLEIGTPLLWRIGVAAIEGVRERFPAATLVADYKIMDRGAEVTTLAAESGADGVVVQAAAPTATLEAVCHAAATSNMLVMVDGLGVANAHLLRSLTHGLPVSHVIIHKGKDEQAADGDSAPVPGLDGSWPDGGPCLAVAGGLAPTNVEHLVTVPEVALIVVGEAIYSSPEPAEVAASLRNLCDSRQGTG
jgi:3-keto-L-gulonate-6-phosphate decarboxylase